MPRPASALIAFALLGATVAHADDAPPITGNVVVTSDYVFRGLSQTWSKPAIQGGGDYAAASGFAAGFWASSISRRSFPGAVMELDVYTSYGQSFGQGWSWRAGLYGYLYPGGNLDHAKPRLSSRPFNTLEANFALGWKWLTLKYNRALTDYFGADVEEGYTGSTGGTSYMQLDAALPLRGAWSLTLHAGHTHYPSSLFAPLPSGARKPDYSDYGATLKYQLTAQWTLGGGVTRATNAAFYRHTVSLLDPGDTDDIGGTRGFVMVQGTF
ncbi:MAG TPA: TorF family putative porin [Rhodanobacter sp.]|nr:TorF family putative porin [Rhodanobacter sp.]